MTAPCQRRPRAPEEGGPGGGRAGSPEPGAGKAGPGQEDMHHSTVHRLSDHAEAGAATCHRRFLITSLQEIPLTLGESQGPSRVLPAPRRRFQVRVGFRFSG